MRNEKFALLNNETTPAEVPDPTPLPFVCGWQILIRPLSVVQKTKGGIILADTLKHDVELMTTVGKVLALGPLAFDKPEFKGAWCKPGDFICFRRQAGKFFLYKGVKLVLLPREEDILMVLKDPHDIDPNYSLAIER